jgi:Domain of unknown function (DUF4333)
MKSTQGIRRATGGVVVALLLGLSGISAGASTGEVPASVVEAQAAKVLASKTGQAPPKIICRKGLEGKVGAHINCALTTKGSKLVYPVRVTVNSVRNGTAHFSVQVGQAAGQANKKVFCQDNAILDTATSAAQTPAALIAAFQANQKAIVEFQATAPSKVVADAGILVVAARKAVQTNDTTAFGTKAIMNAGLAIDAFCGQNSDGSPIGRTA